MELGFAKVRMYEILVELRGRQVLKSWLVVHPVNIRPEHRTWTLRLVEGF